MDPDLRAKLRRLAPSSTRGPDVHKLIEEGKRRHRRRYAAYAGAAAVILMVGSAFMIGEWGADEDRSSEPVEAPTVAPSFPPAGDISFISPRLHRQRPAVFAMNSDGTNVHLLSESSPWYIEWAPDGERFLYSNGISEGHGSLVVEDVTTGSRTKIYVDDDDDALLNPQAASWSPDGGRIAFISTQGDIYLIDPDGTGLQGPIGDTACAVTGLDWSPDSTRLAFTANCLNEGGDDGRGGLGTLDVRTDELTRVALGADPQNPAWSPDGRYIAFDDASGRITLVDVSKDEFEFRPLTRGPDDSDPTWSPDSSSVVYVTEETGNHDIRAVSLNGDRGLSLTSTEPADTAPAWRPRS